MKNLTIEQKETIKKYAQVFDENLENEGNFRQTDLQQDWYECVKQNIDFNSEEEEEEGYKFFKEEKAKTFQSWFKLFKENLSKEDKEVIENWDHNNYETIYTIKSVLPKDAVKVCYFDNQNSNCLDSSDLHYVSGNVYWSETESDYFVEISEYVPNIIWGGWSRTENVYKFDDKFDSDFLEDYNVSDFNKTLESDFREYLN